MKHDYLGKRYHLIIMENGHYSSEAKTRRTEYFVLTVVATLWEG